MRAQLGLLLGIECPLTMRLSPSLMSRMSRHAKKGSFFMPYVVHMHFEQTGGDRVAAVIAKAAGITVEAKFDDVPSDDLHEVRLIADFLHLAYCRALEAAAAISTFDAPAALIAARVTRENLPGASQITLRDGTKAVPFCQPKFFFDHFNRLCMAARAG